MRAPADPLSKAWRWVTLPLLIRFTFPLAVVLAPFVFAARRRRHRALPEGVREALRTSRRAARRELLRHPLRWWWVRVRWAAQSLTFTARSGQVREALGAAGALLALAALAAIVVVPAVMLVVAALSAAAG
ncbi:MAG: hypothetical protein ACKVWR_04215 [Acidimicrobiales bacterium]